MLHAGPQALLFSIRERYWPLNVRNIARGMVRRYVTCFRTNPRPINQIMKSLPSDRVTCQRAFNVVGVDYAGPNAARYISKQGTRTENQ